MAQNIKLKRSSVAGKVPTTSQLEAGELAINTVDGKLYFERDDSTIQSIVTTNALITGSLNINGSITGSSFKGDGSAITGVVTSSYALTASYAANVPETASYALEADKLDGQHGSYYLNATNINAGTISDTYLPSSISSDITGNAATATTASYAVTASFAVTASYIDLSAANYVDTYSTTGANNRIAVYRDVNTIEGDADFTFDGTSVGIGTGTPSEKLTVEGNISASGDLLLAHPNTPMVKLVDTTNDLQARFRVANSYAYLSVDNSDSVGSSRLVFQVDGGENGYFDGNGLNVDGDLTVTGTVTAQEFHTEFVSASVIYQSGSTKFGDTVDDIHSFTGSLEVTGGITGSLLGTATSASYALTASYVDLSAANYVDTYSTTGADNRIAVYRDVNTIEGDTEFTYDGTSLRVNGSQMRYGQSLGNASGKLAFPVGSGTSADGFTADYVITSGSGAGKAGYRAGHIIAAFGINGASPVLTETQTNTIGSMPSIVTAVSASGTDMFLTFEWSGGSSIYSKVNVFTLGL